MGEKQRVHTALSYLDEIKAGLQERLKSKDLKASRAFYMGAIEGINSAKNVIKDVWEDSAEAGL